jgi:TolB-like protein/tetratricopeptide (TPR) repeat protein
MVTPNRVRFGPFELDVRSRELHAGHKCVRLQDQPFEILQMMLERPGDVLTRDELRARLWPEGTFVDFEHSLNAAIKRLRAALGDDAEKPGFIETVPRRGYRFIGSVNRNGTAGLSTTVAASPVRLVVLPFSNLSDDSSQEYFSDGLTEELIAQLGPLCRGRVGIIARWSSMFFKGSLQRAREIGEALNAQYLLEGSTRRDGSHVRITARLIEAATEAHLWSQSYDRTVSDWLSVQSDVASLVARSLMNELVPEVKSPALPQPRPAYQFYLKGRYHWTKPGDTGLPQALVCLRQAVQMAPDYASALGLLSRVLVASAEYYHDVPRTSLIAARESAQAAVAIDPSLSEAVAVIGDIKRMLYADWEGADSKYQEALAANPSNETALRSYGLSLALQGRFAEALKCVEQAREFDPLCLATNTNVAWTRYLARDYEGAIAQCRHTIEMDPEFVGTYRVHAAALLQAGRPDDAVAQLEIALTLAESHPVLLAWLAHIKAVTGLRAQALTLLARARALEGTRYVPPFHLALAYVALGEMDEAFAALDQAWLDRDPALPVVGIDPRFEPLRKDARYQDLVERLNLPRPEVSV